VLENLDAPCSWNMCHNSEEGHDDDVFVSPVVEARAWALGEGASTAGQGRGPQGNKGKVGKAAVWRLLCQVGAREANEREYLRGVGTMGAVTAGKIARW
jgi:hypothetical protein